MKHNILKFVAIAAALLATAVNAGAQYNITNGVGTSKQVTGPDTDGYYTIRLETFATGTTTVTETATPVDVVLVLDVSGSMCWPKGTTTPQTMSLTYEMVANGTQDYFISYNNYTEQVYASYENNRYYLYVSPDVTSRVYLTNNGTTQTRNNAASATSPTGTIVTRSVRVGTSRIHALKDAVCAFIEEIDKNDREDKDGNPRVDEQGNPKRLGNQISIIKFASDKTNTVGNTSYTTGSMTYNYTQIVHNLTPVANNVETLQNSVKSFIARGGTQAGYGFDYANQVLANAAAGHNKVVIMFTDGAPEDNYAAIGNSTSGAYYAKNTRKALVYTVGTFDSSPSSGSTTWRYMNYVSSNYPNATGINAAGTGGSDQGYYQDASGDVDLTAIFVSISEGIGGSEATVGTSTQIRDVVTNSFVLPNDVSAADVHVYTSTATGAASGEDDTDPAGWTTPVALTSVTTTIVNVDANGQPTTDPDKVKNKALFVQGFDYSKDDSAEGAGDGNWVGPRYKNGNWTWAGKKVIITFKVKADGQATGGESQTNTGNSGVWVQGEDGTYTCVNHYDEPHTTLTVNIKIRKTGLRIGESATFELMRIRPKGYNPNGSTNAEKVANLEYNLIGKPKPGTYESTDPTLSPDDPDPSKYYESIGWESFKKVILTNMSDTNGAEVIKDVLALDPYWVYMVVEDDWGWSYEMSGDANQVGDDGTYTTSTVEVNPFRFHNTEQEGVVKHAEAVMVNHFQSVGEGATSYTEHKKSSKVESF